MESANKIAANRENATHSTGPVTDAGKKISSQNSTSHGLTARRVVLENEVQSEFDDMHAGLFAQYAPQGQAEEEVVQEIASAAWRLRRAERLETELFDSGQPFSQLSSELDKLRRYRTSIERAFHKAIEQLRKMQGGRPVNTKATQKKATDQALSKLFNIMVNAPLPRPGGFVSQKQSTNANEVNPEALPDENELETEIAEQVEASSNELPAEQAA